MSAEGKSVQVFGKDSGLLVCNVVREKCPNTELFLVRIFLCLD